MRCRGPHGPRDAKKMKPNCKPKLVRRDLRKVGGAGVPLREEPEGPPGQGAPVREDFSVLHDGIKRQRHLRRQRDGDGLGDGGIRQLRGGMRGPLLSNEEARDA